MDLQFVCNRLGGFFLCFLSISPSVCLFILDSFFRRRADAHDSRHKRSALSQSIPVMQPPQASHGAGPASENAAGTLPERHKHARLFSRELEQRQRERGCSNLDQAQPSPCQQPSCRCPPPSVLETNTASLRGINRHAR